MSELAEARRVARAAVARAKVLEAELEAVRESARLAASTYDLTDLARLEKIRAWLRMRGDYRLTLNPWGMYGLWEATLEGPGASGPWHTSGDTLAHRLDWLETWMWRVDTGWSIGPGGRLV